MYKNKFIETIFFLLNKNMSRYTDQLYALMCNARAMIITLSKNTDQP